VQRYWFNTNSRHWGFSIFTQYLCLKSCSRHKTIY